MLIETVNLHIWSWCNLRCTYCYETFPEKPRSLELDAWRRILDELAAEGVVRVTFSGGEPTLHPDLPGMLAHARSVRLQTSIITNGAKLTDSMIALLDIVGISLDAVDEAVVARLGRQRRGEPSYVEHVTQIAERVHDAGIRLKVNTVVTALNAEQDLGGTLGVLRPHKWKPMQFTRVPGENDQHADTLEVDTATFEAFVERHRTPLEQIGVWVQPESASVVRSTYVMLDPQGRVFQVGTQGYCRSSPVHEVGLVQAVAEAGGYDRAAFLARGGHVDVKRLPLALGGRK